MNSQVKIIKTDYRNEDFSNLVKELDAYLAIVDGNDHAFYSAYNKIENIANVVVIYSGDIPVGCGAFKRYSNYSAEIKRMFVKPDYRGLGLSKIILTELEKWAIESGYSSCILETGKRQIEAVGLYKKSGYLEIPNYGQYVGVENSVCMEKKL